MKNRLLEDCEQLVRNILADKPNEHEYLLALVAKADKMGKLPSASSFPNFYGYLIDGTKDHLHRLKIISNVPKGRIKIMLVDKLVHEERLLNIPYRMRTFDDKLGDMVTHTWAWTKNTTQYKDAELILVFRSKAEKFLNNGLMEDESDILWPTEADIKGTRFVVGEGLEISFRSKSDDRFNLFNHLFEKQGKWVKVSEMSELISKDAHTVRTILNQIQTKKLNGSGLGKVFKIEFSKKYPSAARLVYSRLNRHV